MMRTYLMSRLPFFIRWVSLFRMTWMENCLWMLLWTSCPRTSIKYAVRVIYLLKWQKVFKREKLYTAHFLSCLINLVAYFGIWNPFEGFSLACASWSSFKSFHKVSQRLRLSFRLGKHQNRSNTSLHQQFVWLCRTKKCRFCCRKRRLQSAFRRHSRRIPKLYIGGAWQTTNTHVHLSRGPWT